MLYAGKVIESKTFKATVGGSFFGGPIITVLIIFLTMTASAQPNQERSICKGIETELLRSFSSGRFGRNDDYGDECRMEFSSKLGNNIYIALLDYKTTEKAHEEFGSHYEIHVLHVGLENRDSVKPFDKNHYWSEGFGFFNNVADSMLLLRRDNFTLTLISTNKDFLFKIEKLFRESQFFSK